MRKPIRSLEELIKENKEELMRDPIAMNEIEKSLEERKSKEDYKTFKKAANE